jgi:hypothetical protein
MRSLITSGVLHYFHLNDSTEYSKQPMQPANSSHKQQQSHHNQNAASNSV